MATRPRSIYILILLFISISIIFSFWGGYSLLVLVRIPSWQGPVEPALIPLLFFGYLTATIVWFTFSAIFVIFAYGSLKGDSWIWSTGLIITTIFLVVLGIMMGSLMINSILFLDLFSISGLVTTILSFIADLAIVYFLTRPTAKIYFESIVKK
jgi:hypothetical protein